MTGFALSIAWGAGAVLAGHAWHACVTTEARSRSEVWIRRGLFTLLGGLSLACAVQAVKAGWGA